MSESERKELIEKIEVLKLEKDKIADWMESMSIADEILIN